MPLHPAAVHFPIAFLVAGSLLDIGSYVGSKAPSLLSPIVAFTTASTLGTKASDTAALLKYLDLFSYVSTAVGLLFALPAVVTGILAFYPILKYKGLNFSDPVVFTAIKHSSLSYTAIFSAAYNWWSRRGVSSFSSAGVNVIVSIVMVLATLGAGSHGGALTYEHGVQVRRKVVKGENGKTQ